jgi:hypothetical protein
LRRLRKRRGRSKKQTKIIGHIHEERDNGGNIKARIMISKDERIEEE